MAGAGVSSSIEIQAHGPSVPRAGEVATATDMAGHLEVCLLLISVGAGCPGQSTQSTS